MVIKTHQRDKVRPSEELPVDGANARRCVVGTEAVSQQPITYFPSKHGRVIMLVLGDLVHDATSRHLRLGAANDTRLDGTSLIVPVHKPA